MPESVTMAYLRQRADFELVWVIRDIARGILTIPNLIAMVALAPKVRRATKEYFSGEWVRKA